MRKLLVLGSDYGTLDIVHEAKKTGDICYSGRFDGDFPHKRGCG